MNKAPGQYEPLNRATRPVIVILALSVAVGACARQQTPNPGEEVQANSITGVNPVTGAKQFLGFAVPPINGTKATTIIVAPSNQGPNPDLVVSTGDTGADDFAKRATGVGAILSPLAEAAALAATGGASGPATSVVVGGATAQTIGTQNRVRQNGAGNNIQLAP